MVTIQHDGDTYTTIVIRSTADTYRAYIMPQKF